MLPERRIILSKLSVVEIQSVFAVKVRTGVLTKADVDVLRDLLLVHLAAEAFEVFTLTDHHYEMAERLVWRYGFAHRLRTLDALHLAVALDLRAQGLVDYFVASDKVICRVASLEQFAVINPEIP
jgi:predicted nucleic acid-binding protein